jgi:hypothetical protein
MLVFKWAKKMLPTNSGLQTSFYLYISPPFFHDVLWKGNDDQIIHNLFELNPLSLFYRLLENAKIEWK